VTSTAQFCCLPNGARQQVNGEHYEVESADFEVESIGLGAESVDVESESIYLAAITLDATIVLWRDHPAPLARLLWDESHRPVGSPSHPHCDTIHECSRRVTI